MVLFLIVDVSFGSFQLGPPDANPDYLLNSFVLNENRLSHPENIYTLYDKIV